jgi:hypothetical protein
MNGSSGQFPTSWFYDPLAEDIDQAERLDEYLGLVASTEKIDA